MKDYAKTPTRIGTEEVTTEIKTTAENGNVLEDFVVSAKAESPANMTFGQAIDETYTAEDFTGHIGALLDKNAEDDDINDALAFLQRLYEIASQFVS
jgi:hypothetical protein